MNSRTYFNQDVKQNQFIMLQKHHGTNNLEKRSKTISFQLEEEKNKQLWEIDMLKPYQITQAIDQPSGQKLNIKRLSISFKPGSKYIKANEQEQQHIVSNSGDKMIEELSQSQKVKSNDDDQNNLNQKRQKKNQNIEQNNIDNVDENHLDNNSENNENIENDNISDVDVDVDQQKEKNIKQDVPKIDKKIMHNKLKLNKFKGEKGNFVRQDLKKIYQDRFRGALYMNRRIFKRNGTLKNPTRTKIESKQIEFQLLNHMGQSHSYNIYIQSISSALLTDIYEDDEQILLELIVQNDEIQEQLAIFQESGKQDSQYLKLLQLVFGFDSFREGQLEAIQSIMNNQSILLVQKTGHGKSLVYQFLALLNQHKIGIVLSPLVALMLDQIQKLPYWIGGVAYHSMLTSFQKESLIEIIKGGKVRLLFCTPEIFQSEIGFQLKDIGEISFICVDEAHCISELSHSFRHTYLVLEKMISNFLIDSQPPYLALTATATPQTIRSIQNKFNIQNHVISIATQRENIKITISRDKDVNNGLIKLLQSENFKNLNSIIIYCRSRYMVDQVSNFLRNTNYSCLGFHGQLEEQDKMDIQNKFLKDQIKIVVATSIFAMGIDKSDIRAIIHLNMPKSMEAYLQEIGRAGRDGLTAYCHMFLRESDFHLERAFILGDSPDQNSLLKLIKVLQKWVNEDSEINYLNSKVAEEQLDLRKDNIYNLMLTIEGCSKNILKVYPICHERMIVKFFSIHSIDARKKSRFLESLFNVGKMVKGSLHVNIIKTANKLKMHPQEIIRQARGLFKLFQIKVELVDEIFPFILKKEIDQDVVEQVFYQMKSVKQQCLEKLNIIYLTSYEQSSPNIKQSMESKHYYQQYFDLYFEAENALEQMVIKLYGSIVDVNEYLPFDELDEEYEKALRGLIQRFLNEESANLNIKEQKQKIKYYMNNPNILTKLLCGVSTIKYSYKEFRNSCIWNKAQRLRYEDVHEIVLKMCLQNQN